jgi:alanyl-tRNA synthetase
MPVSQVEIVLPETPFYVESGGQISDTGEIYYFPDDMAVPIWSVEGHGDPPPIKGLIVHIGTVTSGTVRVGDPAYAAIDVERRWDIMRNHTGTHVLHARRCASGWASMSIRPVRWSPPSACASTLPTAQPLSKEELASTLSGGQCEVILANYAVNTAGQAYERAIQEGAMALFGEKYGDEVRVVSFGEDDGVSMELCGGTHVDSTAEIGSFRITERRQRRLRRAPHRNHHWALRRADGGGAAGCTGACR